MISLEIQNSLLELGKQLKAMRLQRNDRQSDFAARLGVSIPTLRKLEQGDPAVAIGTWVTAFWLLDRLDAFKMVLRAEPSLFDLWDHQGEHQGAAIQKKPRTRKRASKR